MRDINNSDSENMTYNEFLNKYNTLKNRQNGNLNGNRNGNASDNSDDSLYGIKSNNSSSSSLSSSGNNTNKASYTSYHDYLKKYETKKFAPVKPAENGENGVIIKSPVTRSFSVETKAKSVNVPSKDVADCKNLNKTNQSVKSELIIQLSSDVKPAISRKPPVNPYGTLPRTNNVNSLKNNNHITITSFPPPPPPPLPTTQQLTDSKPPPPPKLPQSFATLPRHSNNMQRNTSQTNQPPKANSSTIDLLLNELKSKTKRYEPPETANKPLQRTASTPVASAQKVTSVSSPSSINKFTLPSPVVHRKNVSNQIKVNQNVNKVTNQEANVTTVISVNNDNVDSLVKNDPNVKKLVYNTYRGFLGAYNNKANEIISNSTGVIVKENKGVTRQLENLALHGGLDKLNGRLNPGHENE